MNLSEIIDALDHLDQNELNAVINAANRRKGAARIFASFPNLGLGPLEGISAEDIDFDNLGPEPDASFRTRLLQVCAQTDAAAIEVADPFMLDSFGRKYNLVRG